MKQGVNEAAEIVADGIETETMPQSAADAELYHEVSELETS